MVAPPGGAYFLRAIAVRINTLPVRRVNAPAAIPGSISGAWNAACAAPAAAPRTTPAHTNASSRDIQFYPSPCALGTHSQIRPSRAEGIREQAPTAGPAPPWATRPPVPQCCGQHDPSSYQYSSRRQLTAVRRRRVHPLLTSACTIPQESARGKRDRRIIPPAPPEGTCPVGFLQWLTAPGKLAKMAKPGGGIIVVCIRKTERSKGKESELVKRVTSWASPQRWFPKASFGLRAALGRIWGPPRMGHLHEADTWCIVQPFAKRASAARRHQPCLRRSGHGSERSVVSRGHRGTPHRAATWYQAVGVAALSRLRLVHLCGSLYGGGPSRLRRSWGDAWMLRGAQVGGLRPASRAEDTCRGWEPGREGGSERAHQ